MKKMNTWFVILMLMMMVLCAHSTIAQEQKPKIFTPEDLKKIKLNELKDTDIIDINGKHYTIAELKDLEQQSLDKFEKAFVLFLQKVQQELNELRSIEEYKQKTRAEKIRNEITAILKKDKEKLLAETPKKRACEKPTIDSVYPTTVYPGDPVLIKGCKFRELLGMVLIASDKINLINDVWEDELIIARMPRLRGFADQREITFQVTTAKEEMSNLSEKIVLKPNRAYIFLDNRDQISIGVDPQKCYYSGEANPALSAFYIAHSYFVGIDDPACYYGVDTIVNDTQFKNNWRFHSYLFESKCFSLENGNYDMSFCNDSAYARLVEKLENMIGKSSVPRITVSWNGNIAYFGTIFLYGPEGTLP